MTEMARKTISLPPEIERAVYELRKTDEFCKCSYSEILRIMIKRGLQAQGAALDAPPAEPGKAV